MEIQDNQDFIVIQDNGDGSSTFTLNLPDFFREANPVTVVMEGPVIDMVSMMMQGLDVDGPEYKEFEKRTTVIPNEVEV